MLDILIALFASATAFNNRLLNRVRSRLAGSTNIVLTIIWHGTGITVANLFCVTAPGKKLIAYSGIFEQVIVTLRSNEFRECVIGHALARLCLLNPRRVPINVSA